MFLLSCDPNSVFSYSVLLVLGAWIITPGSKSGVYQMVGSAVRDYSDSTGASVMNNIVVMGISSWGAVSERERLESADVSETFCLPL